MKRIFIYGVCFMMILCLTACSTTQKKSLIEIGFEEYQKKIENQEDFILYIGSATCQHCQKFRPILEEVVAEYDLEVFYLDMHTLLEADKNITVDADKQTTYVYNTSKTERTPTVVFAEDGKIKLFPRIEGEVSKSVLVNKLKSAGYIK